MAINYDIALYNNDLLIQDGDIVIAPSDEQHIIDTINAFPGWWKTNPQDGVGLFKYQNSAGKEQELAQEVKIQLQSDGYQVSTPDVSIVGGKLTVNPNATKT